MQKPIKEALLQLPVSETGEHREFSSDEILEATLYGLRTIREASEDQIRNLSPISTQCQGYIADAETLGLSAADYLMHPFGEDVTTEQQKAWFSIVNRISDKYGYDPLKAVTNRHSRTTNQSFLKISSSLDLLRSLCKDPFNSAYLADLEACILEKDKTKLSSQDLCENDLIIFSPLSMDYLIACLFHRYTQQHLSSDCFRLKPLILSRHYEPCFRAIAMPDLKDDDYTGITKTKIFIENNFSGDTMRVCHEAVRRYYAEAYK
ncbi:MAG: hypothetical protein M1426_02890 [Patescibacteria group bacterium]|nr:hypothetical protein [Patescibacteria group bacterium]